MKIRRPTTPTTPLPKAGSKVGFAAALVQLEADGAGGGVLRVLNSLNEELLTCHVPPDREHNAGKWNSISYCGRIWTAVQQMRRTS